jgi:hypothetical protein
VVGRYDSDGTGTIDYFYGGDDEEFDYSEIDSLDTFNQTHPAVFMNRIKQANWEFTFDKSKIKISLKDQFKNAFKKLTGWQIGEYKNYKLI